MGPWRALALPPCLATLAGVSAKDRQSGRGQMEWSDSQAISDAAAELVLKWWPDALPRSPDEAIARLRRVFPPGGTAYTVSLPQTDSDEHLVAVCTRITPGVAYSLLSGGWQRPYFENFSWDIARIGACPVVGDNGLKALKIPADVDLDTMMAQAIWREPRVGGPLTLPGAVGALAGSAHGGAPRVLPAPGDLLQASRADQVAQRASRRQSRPRSIGPRPCGTDAERERLCASGLAGQAPGRAHPASRSSERRRRRR
jgi:hypothetical protein